MSTDEKKFSIRLKAAGLSEVNGEIIAQGFLDIEGITQLKVDDYQREVLKSTGLKSTRRTRLEIAVSEGARLPSIVLGMRGQDFRMSGDDMLLYDPVYIVDGLQRTHAMKSHAEKGGTGNLLIGCEVRFQTSKETEKELFQTLNLRRTPMSPNVILRNARDRNKAILTLYGLSVVDSRSPLFERVQWTQRRRIGEVLTALSVTQVADRLHRHIDIPSTRDINNKGAHKQSGAETKMMVLDKRSSAIGLKTFRENVGEFFDVLDQTFGLRKIEYSELATHLRGNFLLVLAQLFSDHDDFWDQNQLVVNAAHKKKLASFRIDAPEVIRLCGGSNTTRPILYGMLKEHMGKGLKKNHLRPRQQSASKEMDDAA